MAERGKGNVTTNDVRVVTKFADDMAREMVANSHKDGWERMTPRQLLQRAKQEMGELERAMNADEPLSSIRSEAGDVGNFLAMLVWRWCELKRREEMTP
jgi:NTP pyrophosphatase (non-canonical NTP hydrolase)